MPMVKVSNGGTSEPTSVFTSWRSGSAGTTSFYNLKTGQGGGGGTSVSDGSTGTLTVNPSAQTATFTASVDCTIYAAVQTASGGKYTLSAGQSQTFSTSFSVGLAVFEI